MSLARHYWRRRFARWRPAAATEPGYTLLIPVPGDLPVFLRMALAVCRLQAHEHRVETIVVPDRPSPVVDRIMTEAMGHWPGQLHQVWFPSPERWLLPRLRNPNHNHGVQILSGVGAARSSHVVLHDADLFPLDPAHHDSQYRAAIEGGLDVLGVDPAWDPWYAARGRDLAATWEMTAATSWLRSFPPFRLMGHDAQVEGEQHTFDTTFWAQYHSDPARIGVSPTTGGLVHFNYVISTFRKYQRHTGPFHDRDFRLLLIRLFLDAFDPAEEGLLPSADEMVASLGNRDAPVHHLPEDRETYREFRARLDGILDGPWVAARRSALTSLVTELDDYYDYSRPDVAHTGQPTAETVDRDAAGLEAVAP